MLADKARYPAGPLSASSQEAHREASSHPPPSFPSSRYSSSRPSTPPIQRKRGDIDITAECAGCSTTLTGDNLRLWLYPFTALTGDTIRAREIIRATKPSHRPMVTAFTAVEPGQYIVSAAALRPVELDGDCQVSTGATAYPASHYPEEYAYA